jgi:hypothetical protein
LVLQQADGKSGLSDILHKKDESKAETSTTEKRGVVSLLEAALDPLPWDQEFDGEMDQETKDLVSIKN